MVWLHHSHRVIRDYIQRRREEWKARHPNGDHHLAPVIQELHDLIANDPEISASFNEMLRQRNESQHFREHEKHKLTLEELLGLLNKTIAEAPKCDPDDDPIGVPMYAVLKHFIEQPASYIVFTNPKVNAQFQKIFAVWTKFLCSPESCHTFGEGHRGDGGWLTYMEENMRKKGEDFSKVFVCDKMKPHWGFTSWDNFFTRALCPGARPVADPLNNRVINVACESTVYRDPSHDVQENAEFWVKDQPYSLNHMLNNHDLASQFAGGTVIQATLSPLAYHRWHSPINGRVIDTVLVPGTYFAPNPVMNKIFPDRSTSEALSITAHSASTKLDVTYDDIISQSQGFLTAYSTRALIFIESDNPDIGLMCFIGVGLVEISTCKITVAKDQRVKKGDELGMFRFGGSTHCLVFRKASAVSFVPGVQDKKDITINKGLAHIGLLSNDV
ncbi:phosphatidylserine decarboxylase-domain-containing protein [Suillus ampliporus]|nr:phosphatidylserine decarboxylase-domain-containing protein [Suillus ampliporus]